MKEALLWCILTFDFCFYILMACYFCSTRGYVYCHSVQYNCCAAISIIFISFSSSRSGADLIKIFTIKIFVSEVSFAGCRRWKFSIMICINCVGKILVWGRFCSIIEMLLNNLEHFLIIEKKNLFFFSHKANTLVTC